MPFDARSREQSSRCVEVKRELLFVHAASIESMLTGMSSYIRYGTIANKTVGTAH